MSPKAGLWVLCFASVCLGSPEQGGCPSEPESPPPRGPERQDGGAPALHPIDARLAAAIEADGSTAGMVAATRRAQGEWEREIRRLLRELALNLPADSWRSVQASQQAWAAYRDRETETLERIYSPMEGSMYRVLAAGDSLEMHRSRARQLATYLALPGPG